MGYGAKMIASCMIAAGYTLLNKPEGSKITLDYNLVNSKDETKTLLLSSTALWDNATSPKITKEILTIFNKRPENSYGDLARFIILDSGFVEGIDLYDIKYIHMFEEQLYDSQFIQATGRGLRFKGQCGLPFTKNKGWTVEIYNYKLYKMIPRDLSKFEFFNGKENIIEIFKKEDKTLKYKENLQKNLFDILKSGAVDYTLNKNMNGLIDPQRFNLIKTIKLGVSFIRDSIDYKLLQRKKINL
jgi:superfamily II DNA or RNA helicase